MSGLGKIFIGLLASTFLLGLSGTVIEYRLGEQPISDFLEGASLACLCLFLLLVFCVAEAPPLEAPRCKDCQKKLGA